ncbi:hypothetical protein ASZ90_015646 [hydrocarbon metagenome]|uniref:Uncharacterized protein n=1 Tax=hydrocarbon metagenome TaxID=938273 RepID=A0A0W8F1D9_9ZZZZ
MNPTMTPGQKEPFFAAIGDQSPALPIKVRTGNDGTIT